MDYKDYYAILGVPRNADEQTIKSAFRRLARVYHPDVNANKATATEKFKEINEAYTVLSDPDKRARYDLFNGRFDQYGHSGSNPQPGYTAPRPNTNASAAKERPQQQQQRRTSTRTIDAEDLERILRGFAWAYTAAAGSRGQQEGRSSDFSDFFDALFGNRWNTAGNATRQDTAVRPARDIEVTTDITLENALHGATRMLTYSDGRQVEVTIPPGVDSGARLRVAGQGERSFGRPRGDLYMNIQVKEHPIFARTGDDLRVQVQVDHATAMQAGEVQVPTLDVPVTLKIPAGTRSGQSFRLRGLGMPNLTSPTTRGDLIAVVTVLPDPNKSTRKPRTRPLFKGQFKGLFDFLGAVLLLLGLGALALQTATSGGADWQLLAALAVVLLIHAVTARSGWAAAGSLLSIAGAVWLLGQMETIALPAALNQLWPLLPLAAGIVLLRLPARLHT
ncbi:MAG: DnaJ C-terminal domain-containing protein [Anaerolineae bacterium]